MTDEAREAPIHYDNGEALAWQAGFDAGVVEGRRQAKEAAGWEVWKVWYRSLYDGGKVWCESSSPDEVIRLSKGRVVVYERLLIHQVQGVWEPWDAAATT